MEGFDPKEESKGLGDTIAKITNATGLDKLADSVAKMAGKDDCGCNSRRKKLNRMFPYKVQGPPPVVPEKAIGKVKGGTYLVNKRIVYTPPGEKNAVVFYPNDKIFIKEDMPIFENLKYYLANKVLTKLEN
tara:strand:- start:1029 stop:1421 length:393 start_codon:yes stop_codon:yes gene_type:complete